MHVKQIPQSRLIFSLFWLMLATLFAGPSFASGPSTSPNVLIVLTDDQGWGDLSLNGNRNLNTPRIDSLAKNGVQFDRFYVCAVCSPTRAEFLTGRYHARSGVYSTSAGGERMNLDETTIADSFRAAGYRTGAFGKWHNGMQYPYHPNGRGFDEYYGFCSGHWGDYFSPPLEHNGALVQGDGFCIDDFTNKAIEFMRRAKQADEPFFAYLPFNTPHSPMQVPNPYWKRFKDKDLPMHNREPQKEVPNHLRCALAMCENIDWNVGRLLDFLEEEELAEDTIVLYFCDNGPNGVRWNGGMKGRKGSTDEGGVRSPLLIRWPTHLAPGQTIKPIASVTDLLPTLTDLCGVQRIGNKPLDGKSLAPLLRQEVPQEEWPDRVIINQWKTKCSVRNQRFRLDHQGKLFDIVADPEQRHDVSAKHPQEKQTLASARKQHLAEVDGFDNDDRPFLVGHPDYRFTQVPARDASFTGEIQRSNRFPNCSFLKNWTSTEEKIFWDVQVGAAARYKVQLQYACKKENVGSELELTIGDSVLPFKIAVPHDPPLRGMENDRFKRTESYVKDFETIEIGELSMTAGPGRLELRATSIPGDEAIEFRLLMFERLDD